MNQKIIGGIVVVLALIVGGLFFIKKDAVLTAIVENTPATESSDNTTPTATYTLLDVASHNTETSCWSAINGKVYDLTDWIKKHPGGSKAILGICGADGSAAFNGKHGSQDRPENTLTGFFIGELKVE